MRSSVRSLLLAVLLTGPVGAQEGAGQGAGQVASRRDPCAGTAVQDAIAGVAEDGALRLASGATVHLRGLRFPEGAPGPGLAGFVGREAVVTAGEPDRWERRTGRVAAEGAGDLAERLVEAGLALVDAGEGDRLCDPQLLALEETARERRLGLWAGEAHLPLAAAESDRLRERAGGFVLVEGRIRSVGERAQRTYLNFGPDFGRDFAVTLPKRVWTRMLSAGHTARSLRGRRVRARGVVTLWRGPVMEITAPDMIELLPDERRRP